MELRDYQHVATDKVNELLPQVKRLLLVLATGSGKTVIMSYLINQWINNNKSCMLIAHRQELISQASMTLAAFGVRHQLICPEPLKRKIKQMHLQYYGKQYIDLFSKCYVGSAQTVVRRLDKLPRPDYLLVDEAAHAVSNLWRQTIEHFDTLTLGVTATPTRSDRRSLGEVFHEMYVGKDMASIISDGQLCRYDIYSTPEEFDLSQVKRVQSGESKGDYNRKDLDKQIDKPKIVGRAVEHYKKFADGKRAMVFAVSIKHSEHIAEEFRNAGYRFISIDGGTDDAIRYKAFQDLKDHKIDGIVNVDIASEGVSVDGVEVVIMIRPISELAFGLYAQQIGRALRLFPGKDRGIVIDMVGNAKRHGFVENKTDWTLWEGEEKGKRGASENVTKVRTCPQCFHTHEPVPMCPSCGFVYPVESNREYEQIEGDLVQLQREEEQRQQRELFNDMVKGASTAAELAAADAVMGYKSGAAAHRARAKEEKKKAIGTLNKALRYWKETCLWGDYQKHEELFASLFGYTEQESRKLSTAKMNALTDNMRQYVQAMPSRNPSEYSPYTFDFIALKRELWPDE